MATETALEAPCRTAPVLESRDARRRRRRQIDLGPSLDPIRQQGRDPEHRYVPEDWFPTPQHRDRSKLSNRRRVYHVSYRTSSGHTWDQQYEELSAIAREFEEAGINLGWGHCGSAGGSTVRGSVENETDRRSLDPRMNAAVLRLIAARKK